MGIDTFWFRFLMKQSMLDMTYIQEL